MSSQCQSGECNRKAFEMPSGCPPVEKPPIVDVQACELPPLVPTDFEKHPLVVDLPSIPINVSCSCIDIETHMTLADDRHTPNYVSFHQAEGVNDCCMGIYALDLQLNIPTCSSSPPKITGQGSRGITVSGEGHARADEPCMFDLDMDITVPCPLEGITIGDGKGIAKIEKGPPPSFANCNLSFDVNVPCPLPGITFTVTGQASGSIVTGAKSVAADGNNSTVDSGGNGGGRVGGNTVLSFGRPRILSASGASGGGGASGASGGGGGGGSDPCTLELKLNVPCQLPGVSFMVTGQASGGVKPKPLGGSFTGAECKTDLELNVPCQLPNIKVLDTKKPYSPTTQNPKISLKDAIKLLKVDDASGASEECETSLQIEADDITIPCEKISLDITGPATGSVTDSSDDCDKVLSLVIDCQLNNLSLDVSGKASGQIEDATGAACAKKITLDVPCQLGSISLANTQNRNYSGPHIEDWTDPNDPANDKMAYHDNGRGYLPYDFVRLQRQTYSSTGCTEKLVLLQRKFSVPVSVVTGGDGISVAASPAQTSYNNNITTYTVSFNGQMATGSTGRSGTYRYVYGGTGALSINTTSKKIQVRYGEMVFKNGLLTNITEKKAYIDTISVGDCS